MAEWIWREAVHKKQERRLRVARDRAGARRIVVPVGVMGLKNGEERLETDGRGNRLLFVCNASVTARRRRWS
jgi:hypothetical protein